MAQVLVAMSGGVDSSVAAALLIRAGHEVVGVTLKLWGGESDSGCCSVSDVDDARRVADKLAIEHHVFNFGDEFERFVVDPYVADHQQGRTPNPCVECNRHIKFDKLFRRADALGFDLIATGHHARVLSRIVDQRSIRRVGRGADSAKDQSYVLHMLGQDQLARLMLPVGELTKDEVRRIAADLDLATAEKPDSQDVCFIHSGGGRGAFLGDRIPLVPAALVGTGGEHLGSVSSVELLTIGQRRGLNLGGPGGRRYVVDIDRSAGVVTVGRRQDLLTDRQPIEELVWSDAVVQGPLRFQCSAHGRARAGRLEQPGTDRAIISWDEPQPKVAVGQSIAIYIDDVVAGGGAAGLVSRS